MIVKLNDQISSQTISEQPKETRPKRKSDEGQEPEDTPVQNEAENEHDDTNSPILGFSKYYEESPENMIEIDMSLGECAKNEGDSQINIKRFSPEQSHFPVLSPKNRRVVCDMGIPIEVTPIVSSSLGRHS